MKKSMRARAFAPALSVLFFAVSQSYAENISPDVIVVTATRFESAKDEKPIATQIIQGDEIREASATSLSEVLNKLGGVHTRINLSGGPDAPLDLRGFGMTGDQNTLVLLNGQRISENEGVSARISTIPLNSIDRIEILRGAGAVLYGGGATGGTINIITKSPAINGTTGSVYSAVGSNNTRDLRASIQAGDGNLGIALNAQRFASDNFRANNRSEQDSVSGEVRLGGGEEFVSFNFSADNQNARLPGARTEAQMLADLRGTSTPNDYANTKSHSEFIRAEKRLTDVTLAIDAGQRHKDSVSDVGGSGLYNTHVDVASISPRLLWRNTLTGHQSLITAGFDVHSWNYKTDLYSRDENGQQKNSAVYFRDEINFSPKTRLSLGVRRERVTQIQTESTTPLPDTSGVQNLTAQEIALRQVLSQATSIYGRMGKSFRIANIDENRCWAGPCELLKAQASDEKEIGAEWKGVNSSLRASLFDIQLENEIHFNRLVGGFGSNVNLSPTLRRGVEIEGKQRVFTSLDISARYMRTEARFKEGIYGGVNVAGHDVPLVPKDRVGLNVGWKINEKTRLNYNLSYVSKQRFDNDQANQANLMKSYSVSDLKVSHKFGSWRLAVGVNNLFNKNYFSYAITNSTYTSFNAYPDAGRNGYASAEYRF
jgi:iron complex outermembrane receptor protein